MLIELIGRHPDICITSRGLRTGRRDLQSVLDNNCEYKVLEISRIPSHAELHTSGLSIPYPINFLPKFSVFVNSCGSYPFMIHSS